VKIKTMLVAFALATGALITGVPTHAGAANVVSSIDRWDNGKSYSIHWHLDTFDDSTQHINMDCYQGPYVWYGCLESWSSQQYENVSVYLGTPGSTPFKVALESVHSPGYTTKNYPTSGSCCNPSQDGASNPINYPGINNAYEEVSAAGGFINGAVLNLHRPMIWQNENTGNAKRVVFVEG
jgi:hypothetical protein